MHSTAQTIKTIVADHSAKILKANPLLVNARAGKVSTKEFEVYLQNLLFNFQATPVSLKLAVRRAEELGLNEMADFFRDKIIEEHGHDVWAMNDLKSMGARYDGVSPEMVTDATRAMVQYGRDLIAAHPALYFAFMYTLEASVLILGPDLVTNLKKCPISNPSITALSNHVESDQEHAEDDLQVIERMITPELRDEFIAAVERMMTLLDGCLASNIGHA